MDTHKQLFFRYLAQTSSSPLIIEADHAEGVYITDIHGKKYIDMVAGISVSHLGHKHPAIMNAIQKQLDRHLHLMVYGEFIQEAQTVYAMEISRHLPEQLDSVYFVNSGSEAVEGALKLVKRFTGRFEIVSFRNAYHGSTAGALSVMGNEHFKRPFRPLIPDIRFLDFNQPEQLEQITNKTAGVIVEPVQGEAGVIFPQDKYLKKLRTRCDETGALLIFDEVQTGFGRIGDMFAFQQFDVIPDILVLGKALGGGLPLGAFISSGRIMKTLTQDPELGHITTFGGNPLSCAAGLGALKFLDSSRILNTVREKGNLIREKMNHPLIREVRGDGLFFAIDLDDSGISHKVGTAALNRGVITDWFLFRDQAFRISPPLTITDKELATGCDLFLETMDDVQHGRIS
ncbi:MAG TPA: aspartate aminotransferase family protein [Bacteroidetes bacterium]|nr:aspartate aminotransferase family protein [Bacteroidota bacterium]